MKPLAEDIAFAARACPVCGNVLPTATANYCSSACSMRALRNGRAGLPVDARPAEAREERRCVVCGSPFETAAGRNGMYCRRACYIRRLRATKAGVALAPGAYTDRRIKSGRYVGWRERYGNAKLPKREIPPD